MDKNGCCTPWPSSYRENRMQMLNFLDTETECPLGVQVVNAGLSVTSDHAYRLNGSFRPEAMVIWQYTLEGCGAIDLAGRTVLLPPGSAFFVHVPDNHIYYLPAESAEWRFLYFSLNGPETERLFGIFTEKYGHVLRHKPDSPSVRLCRELIEEAGENGLPDRFQLSARAYQFLTALFHEREGVETGNTPHPLAGRLSRLLLEHPEETSSVGEIARRFGCSRAHFTRKFLQENGIPPARFLLELRMRLARRFLESEPDPVKEIAFRTGFSSTEYFCKVFRKSFGCSPGEYRRRIIR